MAAYALRPRFALMTACMYAKQSLLVRLVLADSSYAWHGLPRRSALTTCLHAYQRLQCSILIQVEHQNQHHQMRLTSASSQTVDHSINPVCMCRTCCSTTSCAKHMGQATPASMAAQLSRQSMRLLLALRRQPPPFTWSTLPSPT